MKHIEFLAPRELSDAINCFWYDYREFGEQTASFEVLPDGYVEIIFYFGSDCSLLDNGNLKVLPSPFIIGLLDQPIHFYAKNKLEIIGIRCYPWKVTNILSLSDTHGGVSFFEHPITQLQDKLCDLIHQQKIPEAVTLLKDYCLTLPYKTWTDETVSKAGNAMNEAGGNIPVSLVAKAAHATVRTLERKFKQSSGHTVKDVTALMRFQQVRNELWINPNQNIASLAQQFGYTDQSHLSREFKRFSDTTPAAFARAVKKGERIFVHDFVAFIQA